MRRPHHFFKRHQLTNHALGIIIVLAIGLTGTAILLITHAASPYASGEAETGSLANGAITQTDNNASGKTYVKFGTASTGGNGPGIYVAGNKLVNGKGSTVILHGVDRSSAEYECIGGSSSVFDGATDQTSVNDMLAWHINAVRIPMNSACWLNQKSEFGTYNAASAGQNYINAIVNYVNLLNQNGIYAILDWQWHGCGTSSCLANWQKAEPDRPDAVDFWTSVATTFKNNHSVLFDLYNEPTDDGSSSANWACWENGGCTVYGGTANQYTWAGMQEMVTAVRNAGATTQPLLLGGLKYSNDVTQWLSHEPTDPDNGIVMSYHLYQTSYPCPWSEVNGPGNASNAEACLSSGTYSISSIAAKVPVVFGELGETDCASSYVAPLLSWLDTKGYSYLGWSWTVADCSNFPSIVSNYNGTPTAFGSGFKNYYTATWPATGPIQ